MGNAQLLQPIILIASAIVHHFAADRRMIVIFSRNRVMSIRFFAMIVQNTKILACIFASFHQHFLLDKVRRSISGTGRLAVLLSLFQGHSLYRVPSFNTLRSGQKQTDDRHRPSG